MFGWSLFLLECFAKSLLEAIGDLRYALDKPAAFPLLTPICRALSADVYLWSAQK
jgi:hypothetical protein